MVLVTPENPALHGAEGKVAGLEPWGAHVATPAAASGTFRAGWEEMEPVRHLNGCGLNKEEARDQGYTGETCDVCQSLKVRWNGPCKICDDCGASGGCG